MVWIGVGVGGALGSIARHGVELTVARVFGHHGSAAKALVNVIGCAAIGILAGAIAGKDAVQVGVGLAAVFAGHALAVRS